MADGRAGAVGPTEPGRPPRPTTGPGGGRPAPGSPRPGPEPTTAAPGAGPLHDRLLFNEAQGLLAGLTGATPHDATRAMLRTAATLGLDPSSVARRFLRVMTIDDDDHTAALLVRLAVAALTPDTAPAPDPSLPAASPIPRQKDIAPSAAHRPDREATAALDRVLDTAEHASPVEAVEAVTHELGHALGATAVSFLIPDLSGRGLIRLTHIPVPENGTQDSHDSHGAQDAHGGPPEPGARRTGEESATLLPFDGGAAEHALRTQTVQVQPPGAARRGAPPGRAWTVFAPVTERGEVLGLLEMFLPAEPDADTLTAIARTAHVLGFVVIANRRHTDLFESGQRSVPFSLPAEIQRRLLPAAFTCQTGTFTLSAGLEPAAEVGGDTFDYSLARDVLHLSVTDAMGHGIASALTATLCVGSLRNTRRHGASLLEQAAAANTALVQHAEGGADEGFVTGLLGRLDLPTGTLTLLNAGHVAPYLARTGAVTRIDLPPDLPLGLFADATYTSTELTLQPGDRLVVVTDGMLERNAATLDLAAAIHQTRHLHPRETTSQLADSVLDAAGPALHDDATLLVLDWHGHHHASTTADSTPAPSDHPR